MSFSPPLRTCSRADGASFFNRLIELTQRIDSYRRYTRKRPRTFFIESSQPFYHLRMTGYIIHRKRTANLPLQDGHLFPVSPSAGTKSFVAHCQATCPDLMVDVKTNHFGKEVTCFFLIPQAQISESHDQITVKQVAHIQVVLPNQQVGQ